MTRVLVIDNYDSFVYTLNGYLLQLGAETDVRAQRCVRGVATRPRGCASTTRSCSRPDRARPSHAGVSIPIVQRGDRVPSTPLLGVCLGHQAIAEALGATVTHAEELMHGKTSLVTHDDSAVLRRRPAAVHRDQVPLARRRRRHASPTNSSSRPAPPGGVIMGLRHASAPGLRRAVPPGVGAHRGWLPDARQLARRQWSARGGGAREGPHTAGQTLLGGVLVEAQCSSTILSTRPTWTWLPPPASQPEHTSMVMAEFCGWAPGVRDCPLTTPPPQPEFGVTSTLRRASERRLLASAEGLPRTSGTVTRPVLNDEVDRRSFRELALRHFRVDRTGPPADPLLSGRGVLAVAGPDHEAGLLERCRAVRRALADDVRHRRPAAVRRHPRPGSPGPARRGRPLPGGSVRMTASVGTEGLDSRSAAAQIELEQQRPRPPRRSSRSHSGRGSELAICTLRLREGDHPEHHGGDDHDDHRDAGPDPGGGRPRLRADDVVVLVDRQLADDGLLHRGGRRCKPNRVVSRPGGTGGSSARRVGVTPAAAVSRSSRNSAAVW